MAAASGRGLKAAVFGAVALLAGAGLSVGGTGSVTAGAESEASSSDAVSAGDALPDSVVVGVAPEWPFQGFFVAHLGRFWDTGRGQVHDTGPHLNRWGYMHCLHEYFSVDEQAVRVGYGNHGRGPLVGYVIPWGDVAYPVIDGRSMPIGLFDAWAGGRDETSSARPGPLLDLRADPRVEVTDYFDADYAVGGRDGTDGLELPARWSYAVGWSLAAFRMADELESESGAGKWYLIRGKVRGFVETPPVVAGEMDPELVFDAVTDDRGRGFGGYDPYVQAETDGRYYGLEMWDYSEANCSHDYRTFVVDGASGEVVGCFETPSTELGSGLVFVAAPPAGRLERFELPSAPAPVGLDACGYRLDGPELDGFPFAGASPRGGGE